MIYTPQSLSEVLGQDRAVAAVRDFITNFKQKKKKALFLHGVPGVGKTSLAHAAAKEFGLEIVEVNASDFRDEKRLTAVVGVASRQMSLFGKGKILLIDEVDGIYAVKDRGAVPAIVKMIKNTAFPIILTGNSIWDRKFSKIRSACNVVELKPIEHKIAQQIAKNACRRLGIEHDDKALSALARRSGGDIRGLLTDIETLSDGVSTDKLNIVSERSRTESIVNAMLRVFKTTDANVARAAYDNLDENLDDIFLWIEENLPKEYEGSDICKGFDILSKVDVLKGRIRRRQEWHLLATIAPMLSAGIALSKDKKYTKFVKYTPPTRILQIWKANQKYAKRKSVSQKVASKVHCSTKVALKSYVPYIKGAIEKGDASELCRYFEIDDDEIESLRSI